MRFVLLLLVSILLSCSPPTPEKLAKNGDLAGLLKRLQETPERPARAVVLEQLVRFPASAEVVTVLRQEQARDPQFAATMVTWVKGNADWARLVIDWVGDEPAPDPSLVAAADLAIPAAVDQKVQAIMARELPADGFQASRHLLATLDRHKTLLSREANATLAVERLSGLLPKTGSMADMAAGATTLGPIIETLSKSAPADMAAGIQRAFTSWTQDSMTRLASECAQPAGILNLSTWVHATEGWVPDSKERLGRCLAQLDVKAIPAGFLLSKEQMETLSLTLEGLKGRDDARAAAVSLLSLHARQALDSSTQILRQFSDRNDLVTFLASSPSLKALADPISKRIAGAKIKSCTQDGFAGAEDVAGGLIVVADLGDRWFQLDSAKVRLAARRLAGASLEIASARAKVSETNAALASAKEELQTAKALASRYRQLHAFMVALTGENQYEISLPAYSNWFGALPSANHAVLFTRETSFTTTGWFNLWVERGEDRTITTTSGFVQDWPTFTEVSQWTALAAQTAVREALDSVRQASKTARDAQRLTGSLPGTICREVNSGIAAYAQGVRSARPRP